MAGNVTGRVRSADGTEIAFDRVGEGPHVVLVGGALNLRAFPPLAEMASLLASGFNVINYDRRGRGDSGAVADALPFGRRQTLKGEHHNVAAEDVAATVTSFFLNAEL